MRCAKCSADNPSGKKFCGDCGASLGNSCPKCGAENPESKKFCGDCGTALTAGFGTTPGNESRPRSETVSLLNVADRLETAAVPEGERKTVTALFADIKGSTELMAELDPEAARAIIDPALNLMIDAVHRYDGYIVQSTGDGIFALFGAPVAHEDHPQRALYAALRMQEELRRYSARLREGGNLAIEARVGLNTGEVVVRSITTGEGHTEYTPIGHTANLASRMQALAPTGSIAATETTEKLCAGYFSFKALGPTRVKGVSEPVNVFEVTGLGPLRTRLQRATGRGLTKFVGREREMEALKHAAEQAKAGRGQIVAAMAEAGIGKSRLLYEFKAIAQAGWMVLETFSVSHGKASAYLPVIDLLRNYFRIAGEDDERTRREKVAGRIAILDRALEDTLPYFYSLLGIVEGADPMAQMDGQIKKKRTLDAIKRIVLRESLNQPLMVIFEDLHWMDAESQALLNLLADSIANAHVLMLVNYRPEYRHDWGNKTYYTQIRLNPLGKESAEEMLTVLLGETPELTSLKHLIVQKTEGNPFFMEELVQSLMDRGTLVRDGLVKLTRPLDKLQIPSTVQAILAARIDRLPPDEKGLLQTLAVLGKEFGLSQLKAAAAKSDSELERMLSDLQLAEFIYEQPAAGDVEYTFKHALTQEVTYNSILVERRKQIHERAAQAIESLFASSLSDHYDDLARHYHRSGNAPKAVKYLHLAAQQAMNRSAYTEASDQLTAALELLRTQPDDPERDRTELGVRLSLAFCVTLGVSGAFTAGATVDLLERARGLCEKVGDDASLLGVLAALAFIYCNRPDRQKARAVCEELLGIAIRMDDPEKVGQARFWFGFSSLWEGNFSSALQEFDQVYRLAKGASSKPVVGFGGWRSDSRAFASLALWFLGYPERATARSSESFAVAREIASPSDLTAAVIWAGGLNVLLREPKTARAHADEARRLAHEHGLTALLGASFSHGWALAHLGQLEEGLSEMLRCRIELSGTPLVPWAFAGLAGSYLAAGRAQEGLEAADEGLELIQRTGSRCFEAEMRRLKGELLLMDDSGAISEAAQCFRDAIEVARSQSAKSWELRATMSLARLLANQDRRAEARTMLAAIYGWFTEGFDTADLRDAKALLEELGA
jgi:class 3 adenylate cyclase/tetratricopeptide (TPR) repeat protein